MQSMVYAAVIERLQKIAAKEERLPVEARVASTVVRMLTEPMPERDIDRQERVGQVVFELTQLSLQLSALIALGLGTPVQDVACQSTTALMFGLEMALVASDAGTLDVSVLSA